TRCKAFARGCLLSWSCEITPVSYRAERAGRKMSARRRQAAHAADRRAVWQKPAFSALADAGDLGVKASPARPRSSRGQQQRISNPQVAGSNPAGDASKIKNLA